MPDRCEECGKPTRGPQETFCDECWSVPEADAATDTRPFQIEVERDEGLRIVDGQVKPWQGWRVKYRPLGSRGRWSKFVTDDDLTQYGVAELQEFCRLHAERAT